MKTVFAIRDKDSGLYWNRIHKKFLPLSQNTAFYKRPYEPAEKIEYYVKAKIAGFQFFNLCIDEIELRVEASIDVNTGERQKIKGKQ